MVSVLKLKGFDIVSVKINYYYKNYENCPEATEISFSRGRGKVNHYLFCFIIFFMSLLFCFVDSADRWIAICGVVICPVWFFYLVKFYDSATERMIKQAIERQNKNNSERML